jgi:ubiquinone/menaquinone biosynthesis C-methylase UbiE
MSERPRLQRAIGAVYSGAAGRLYEPVVIRGGFRLLGGDLNALVMAQNRRAAHIADGRPILDVPVGTGYFTTEMAALHRGLLVGADYAWGMAVESARTAERAGTPNLASMQTDVHRLPFADGSFAVLLCVNGLQVIPDVRGAVREAARVLAPRGTMLVSVITAPLDSVLPEALGARMPTVLRSGRAVAAELQRAGLRVTAFRRRRLASVMEAVK